VIVFSQGRKRPIDIARARDWPVGKTGDSYFVKRAVLKFRLGSVLLWEQAARELSRPELAWGLFTLQVDLIMRRATSIKLTEAERILGRGVPSLCCRLGIARRDTTWLTFLDVEKTVHESLMRREHGLKKLPATRSRDLVLKLGKLHLAARGSSLDHTSDDERSIEALRARAPDKEICRRWQVGLLSRLPKVKTIGDLFKHWNHFA
jgi:hypothetical protein